MSEINKNLAPGTAGGTHAVHTPLTTSLTNEAAPGLLRNAIDQRIARVRPMSTPVDQLSRCAGSRPCGSMQVEYYTVDTKQTEARLTESLESGMGKRRSPDFLTWTMNTDNNAIFEPSETVLVPSVEVDGNPLMLYVVSRPDDGSVEVYPVNGPTDEDTGARDMPQVKAGSSVVRMGRAASELDVQTAQFAALPHKSSNNCQIFKMQIEQSTLQKIANKEVGWSFSDQEEAAIIDMRLGMEKNFMFGSRAKVYDPVKGEEVMFTGGIWGQTDNEASLNVAQLDAAGLVKLCRQAFTGNNGSKRKILIAGTGLVEALSHVEYTRTVSAGETMTKWGIEFKEIHSNFGTLYVLHSEVFDQCGHEDDGFILDPDYVTKYCHLPFRAETLDLRRSGQRNTDAVVLTEASCLVLRYPKAHVKVKGVRN